MGIHQQRLRVQLGMSEMQRTGTITIKNCTMVIGTTGGIKLISSRRSRKSIRITNNRFIGFLPKWGAKRQLIHNGRKP